MASQNADTQGFVTQASVEHYANLAKSGAGLVMVEYSFMQVRRSETIQLGADRDEHIEGMALADVIHEADAKAGFQLTHCGGKHQEVALI